MDLKIAYSDGLNLLHFKIEKDYFDKMDSIRHRDYVSRSLERGQFCTPGQLDPDGSYAGTTSVGVATNLKVIWIE